MKSLLIFVFCLTIVKANAAETEKTINWVHDQYVPTSPLSFGEGACEA